MGRFVSSIPRAHIVNAGGGRPVYRGGADSDRIRMICAYARAGTLQSLQFLPTSPYIPLQRGTLMLATGLPCTDPGDGLQFFREILPPRREALPRDAPLEGLCPSPARSRGGRALSEYLFNLQEPGNERLWR